jgi:glycogen operon protein
MNAKDLNILRGSPEKLGATVENDGVNFAVFSPSATQLYLLLFDNVNDDEPSRRIDMFRTGDIWHVFVAGAGNGTLYNFVADGPFTPEKDGKRFDKTARLTDPRAVAIAGDSKRKGKLLTAAKCVAFKSNFDWEGDKPLNRSLDETVIYEVLLPAFTSHTSSKVGARAGTYAGFEKKIPHVTTVATAVEVLPINEFDRDDPLVNDAVTGEPCPNVWGYQTLGFFAPKSGYAYYGKVGQQIDEVKRLAQKLHRAGLEFIVDVVFNHTREAGETGPTLCFRGLANEVYYLLVPGAPQLYESEQHPSYTGCKNTVRTNHPAVRKFILDCLRYWVTEYHVDGFRFDLAAVFALDENGVQQQKTLLIQEMEADPILAGTKLIAEPWSTRQYLYGSFSDKRWAEWSDKFRDAARRFVRAEPGVTGELATRIAGSRDNFAKLGRRPVHFVTCHDGFTMNDLVSYDTKHNEANGEDNRDGSNQNYSWNCGYEGDVWASGLSLDQKLAIEALRNKQVKNFLTLLFLSQGVPMLLYGDEMRRTRKGNNNPYNQPELEQLDWRLIEQHPDILRFTQEIFAFRQRHQIISAKGCLDPTAVRDIVWHGTKPNQPDFGEASRFLAWTYEPYKSADNTEGSIYVAANAWWGELEIELPSGHRWLRVVDTSRGVGEDIVAEAVAQPLEGSKYVMQPRSTVVFVAAK